MQCLNTTRSKTNIHWYLVKSPSGIGAIFFLLIDQNFSASSTLVPDSVIEIVVFIKKKYHFLYHLLTTWWDSQEDIAFSQNPRNVWTPKCLFRSRTEPLQFHIVLFQPTPCMRTRPMAIQSTTLQATRIPSWGSDWKGNSKETGPRSRTNRSTVWRKVRSFPPFFTSVNVTDPYLFVFLQNSSARIIRTSSPGRGLPRKLDCLRHVSR